MPHSDGEVGPPREGLGAARFLMVLSSFSPLFILWAIRGTPLIRDRTFVLLCIVMVIVPNLFFWWRVVVVKKENNRQLIIVGSAEDRRDHVLVYLFAMLLPFYSEDLGDWRVAASTLVALAIMIVLFWHLDLHYTNLIFAILGYRVFTIHPAADGNQFTGKRRTVVITRRAHLSSGDQLFAVPVSHAVFLEVPA